MSTLTALLGALPMRDIKERAGSYGNCGGVALAHVHIERGTGGVEVVDVLENLSDHAVVWRDSIDEFIGLIAEGVKDGFGDELGAEPDVRVLLHRINPDPTTYPGHYRRVGRRLAEEALRRACPPAGSIDDLLSAIPMRDIDVRVGTQTNCAGVARALVDIEAGTYPTVELVHAVPPETDADLAEIAEMCADNIGSGVQSGFRIRFGAEPPVRVVLRQVLPHRVDANEAVNRRAGREVVEEVLRRLRT